MAGRTQRSSLERLMLIPRSHVYDVILSGGGLIAMTTAVHAHYLRQALYGGTLQNAKMAMETALYGA